MEDNPAIETFALTRDELHEVLGRVPGWVDCCPSFWNDETVCSQVTPLLIAAVADVMLRVQQSHQIDTL